MSNEQTEQQLDTVTDGLRAVVRKQQQGDPSHEGFYTWGWALSELTANLQDVARLLGRQVSAYGSTRVLRDDEGSDPYRRLTEARRHLDAVVAGLGAANDAARLYHSAVGHIAVEVDPEASA